VTSRLERTAVARPYPDSLELESFAPLAPSDLPPYSLDTDSPDVSMLGSIATLRHASSRAIRTLEDSIETAERLAEEMDITRSGSDADDDTDEEATQEFTPHQARDRLAEVYRPLMPGRQMSGLSNRTTRTERSRRARERTAQDEERAEMKEVRKLEIFISYTCFLILGESYPVARGGRLLISMCRIRHPPTMEQRDRCDRVLQGQAGGVCTPSTPRLLGLLDIHDQPSELSRAGDVQTGGSEYQHSVPERASTDRSAPQSSVGRRVYGSIVLMTIILALLLMSTRVEYIPPEYVHPRAPTLT
jgi:hypothetical protein